MSLFVDRWHGQPNSRPPRDFWVGLTTGILVSFFAVVVTAAAVGFAGAQPASADHGTGTETECETFGCLYGHDRCHHERDGRHCTVAYGIAFERLPDGPDGRWYDRVLWPALYDPSRRAMWDQVAGCESTHRWDINTGNGYYGGLQFVKSTWSAYGGQEFATYPHQAAPEQQIAVAERVLWAGHGQHGPQGRGAWPHCGHQLVAP